MKGNNSWNRYDHWQLTPDFSTTNQHLRRTMDSKETGQNNDKMSLMSLFGANSGPGSNFHSYVHWNTSANCKKKTLNLQNVFPMKETGNMVLWRNVWLPDICPTSTSTSSVAWNIKVLWRWILGIQGKPTEKSARNGAGSLQKYHMQIKHNWLIKVT